MRWSGRGLAGATDGRAHFQAAHWPMLSLAGSYVHHARLVPAGHTRCSRTERRRGASNALTGTYRACCVCWLREASTVEAPKVHSRRELRGSTGGSRGQRGAPSVAVGGNQKEARPRLSIAQTSAQRSPRRGSIFLIGFVIQTRIKGHNGAHVVATCGRSSDAAAAAGSARASLGDP
jgi:hypothetical protein